jgi:hypothetical protein
MLGATCRGVRGQILEMHSMKKPPQTLSSATTAFEKFVLPSVVLLVLAGLTWLAWLYNNGPAERGGGAAANIPLTVAFAAVAVFFLARARMLKRVRMDSDSLYISNYRTEFVVPLVHVAEVIRPYRDAVWAYGLTIKLDARWDCKEITFIPKHSILPVEPEIHRAVSHAKSRARQHHLPQDGISRDEHDPTVTTQEFSVADTTR